MILYFLCNFLLPSHDYTIVGAGAAGAGAADQLHFLYGHFLYGKFLYVTIFILTKVIRLIFKRYKIYTVQSLHGSKFIRFKIYTVQNLYSSKFIRFKVYTVNFYMLQILNSNRGILF
jgi:hypothetical protein